MMRTCRKHCIKSCRTGLSPFCSEQRAEARSTTPVLKLAVVKGIPKLFAELVLTATVYARQLKGGVMANGQRYDPSQFPVAMNGRPLNSKIIICRRNLCVPATVTDRMGSGAKRASQRALRRVDLSPALARRLGIRRTGKVVVR